MARVYRRDSHGRFARGSGARTSAVIGANALLGATALREGRRGRAALHGAKIATTGAGYVAARRSASANVQKRIRHADKAVNAGLVASYTATAGVKVVRSGARISAARQASSSGLFTG